MDQKIKRVVVLVVIVLYGDCCLHIVINESFCMHVACVSRF
jgi:hypothetical protein